MRSLTFTLSNDTDSPTAPATITITELDDGTLQFTITNTGDGDNMIADIRGMYFDVADDSLLGTLSAIGGDVTGLEQDGDVENMGYGLTSSGVGSYEVGISLGTQGISNDDLQTTTFTLSSSLRGLTLDDLSLENFFVRQQSVGEEGGGREGSDKLNGVSPYPVNAIDDDAIVFEDSSVTGNVFDNDIDLDNPEGLVITDVNGDSGSVGATITLSSGATLTVNSDGTYSVDASDLDWLSEGQQISDSFTYGVNDGNGGSDSATVNILINGLNDLPIALDDANSTDESTAVSGNVLPNDSDPDLLDTLTVSGVNGDSGAVGSQITLSSGALLTLNADGSYVYDPNGQFDYLMTGETATDSFTYEISDGHGVVDTATVSIDIAGIGEDIRPWEDQDHFGTFANKKGVAQAISNVVLYLQDGDDITKVKIDNWDGAFKDLDDVDLGNFLDTYFADADLVAVSIKAGNNHNVDLGPGEGQLFLLDGDEDIDYVAGGPVPDGLTAGILAAKADYTYDYDLSLFG